MTKKGKGIKTGGKMKAAKPPIITQAVCQFCTHRAELQASSQEREGSTLLCHDHVGVFFAVWSGGTREFTVVKL